MQSIINWREVNLRKKDPGLPTDTGIGCLVRWKDGNVIRTKTATWWDKYFISGNEYIHPKTGMLWCRVDEF